MLAGDCLEEFKVECDLRRLSPRTTKGYYNSTSLFLNYLEKHENLTELESIRHQHIKLYVQYLIKKKLSPSYINGILKCLRAFFKYAHTEEYIPSNPATKVNWQREGTVLIETFTDEEVRSLLKAFDFSTYLSIRSIENYCLRHDISRTATTQHYIGIEPQRIEQAIQNHSMLI